MSKDKMILKDGTEIELEAGASLSALQIAAADRAEMLAVWQQLTPENLQEVQIQNGDGLTIGRYTDLVLVSERSVVASDGSVLTTYQLREKTTEEKRLDALEEGQAILDEAVGDLGAVTSAMAAQDEEEEQ